MMCSVTTALAPGPRETVVAFATLLDSTTGRPIWTPLAANTTRGYPVREHGAEPVFVTTRSTLRVAAPDEASSWASTLMDPEAQGPPASAARPLAAGVAAGAAPPLAGFGVSGEHAANPISAATPIARNRTVREQSIRSLCHIPGGASPFPPTTAAECGLGQRAAAAAPGIRAPPVARAHEERILRPSSRANGRLPRKRRCEEPARRPCATGDDGATCRRRARP